MLLGRPRPPAHHDAVEGAHALDLDHALALAGPVGRVETLGDHALRGAQPLRARAPGPSRSRPGRAPWPASSRAGAALGEGRLEQGLRRRGPAGRRRRSGPGSPRASRAIRDAAGWMRCCSRPNSSAPPSPAITISPSSDVAAGREGRARGSSAPAACRRATGSSRRRRRRTRSRGSRRACARTTSPRPRAARGPSARAGGGAAGRSGRVTPPNLPGAHRSTGTPTRLPYSVQEPS